MQEGEGTLFYSNGDIYTGTWEAEKKAGQGTYMYKAGRYVKVLMHIEMKFMIMYIYSTQQVILSVRMNVLTVIFRFLFFRREANFKDYSTLCKL